MIIFFDEQIDIRVGDFVLVSVYNKFTNKKEKKIAKVVFVSSEGEVSNYATSFVIEKVYNIAW